MARQDDEDLFSRLHPLGYPDPVAAGAMLRRRAASAWLDEEYRVALALDRKASVQESRALYVEMNRQRSAGG